MAVRHWYSRNYKNEIIKPIRIPDKLKVNRQLIIKIWKTLKPSVDSVPSDLKKKSIFYA